MEANEKKYWQDKAALLDPNAYQLKQKNTLGAAYSETVPAGEAWYIVNSFYCRINGAAEHYTHRVPDVDTAMLLPSGAKIQFHSASSYGMYLVCKPQLVIDSDPRYDIDPRGLYFDRINRLKGFTLMVNSVSIPYGTPNGTTIDSAFPLSLDRAMCMSYANADVSWGGIAGSSGAINLGNEISDDHQNRIGQRAMFPFSRSMFDKMRARGSNVAGNSGFYMQGNAQITYCALPLDW